MSTSESIIKTHLDRFPLSRWGPCENVFINLNLLDIDLDDRIKHMKKYMSGFAKMFGKIKYDTRYPQAKAELECLKALREIPEYIRIIC